MMIISPEQFKRAFLEALPEVEEAIASCWTGSQAEFTEAIRALWPRIAVRLGLSIYNGDYYTLDAIFYEDKDLVHFKEPMTYAKYIAVAFEHENRLPSTAIEMNKLQIINSPLKVLVTYAGDERTKDRYLSMYADIVGDADVFGDFSTLRKQLVVFGACDGTRTEWSFHVYRNGAFAPV